LYNLHFTKSLTNKLLRRASNVKTKKRALSEVEKAIDRATKFSEDLSKQTDDTECLSMINDDVKKSSIFDLDEL
jgi:hypothetical protein